MHALLYAEGPKFWGTERQRGMPRCHLPTAWPEHMEYVYDVSVLCI